MSSRCVKNYTGNFGKYFEMYFVAIEFEAFFSQQFYCHNFISKAFFLLQPLDFMLLQCASGKRLPCLNHFIIFTQCFFSKTSPFFKNFKINSYNCVLHPLCAGYPLLPPGKADNLSDSSHSEISSRSSICSVDSVPAPGLDDRCNSSNSRTSAAAANVAATSTAAAAGADGTAGMHTHSNADHSQPSTR